MNIAVCLKCIMRSIFREFNITRNKKQAADFSPLAFICEIIRMMRFFLDKRRLIAYNK